MLKEPPDVLITTPESLYLMLTSRARDILQGVETIILDEIHTMVPTKRGTHLFLSLERLEQLRRQLPGIRPMQRIGLSATQRPLEEVARLMGGFEHKKNNQSQPRTVQIIDASEKRPFELTICMPLVIRSISPPMSSMSSATPPRLRFLHPSGLPFIRALWP